MKFRTVFVLTMVLGFGSNAIGGQFSVSGVGGGGWLQSGAFHPTDPDVILVGTDMAGGIYKTSDFGDSWSPFNSGLQNMNEKPSNYVEDLMGFASGDGTFTGFIAATYGGIYFRNDMSNAWTCETPMNSYYYSTSNGSANNNDPENYIAWTAPPDPEFPMPFSCLTAVGDIIYAGTGRVRWNSSYETSYYPGIPNNATHYFTGSPQSNTDQFTVWEYDYSGSRTWAPFSGGGTFGAARDISAANINGHRYIAVATPDSIMLWNDVTQTWENLGNIDLEFGSNTYTGYYPNNLTCWSIHLTHRGTLYAAMQKIGADAVPSGVFRIYDINAVDRKWVWVGDDSLARPGGVSVRAAGLASKNLIYLTVRDANANDPDMLYLGDRRMNLGLYKGTQPYVVTGETGSWRQEIYSQFTSGPLLDHDGNEIDRGWLSSGAAVIFHPAVSLVDTNRVLIQLNGRIHVSDTGGATWKQSYTSGSNVSGWETKGYNELSIEDLAVDGAGNLLLSAADEGLFRSVDDGWKYGWGRFININPAIGSLPNQISNKESGKLVILPQWGASGQEAIVVHFGDMIQKSDAGKIMMLQDNSWTNITGNVANPEKYLFPSFVFTNEDTMFATYLEYSLAVGDSASYFVNSGVMRFDYDGGNWNYILLNNGLDGAGPNSNAYGSSLVYSQPTGKVFLSSMFVNLSSLPTDAPNHDVIRGSLYSLQNASDTTWEQQIAFSDTSNFRDVRCMAQSADGNTLYIGTRGRSSSGYGTVLRCNPADLQLSVQPLVNLTSTDFGFEVPVGQGWSPLKANRMLTDVRAIAVDPDNPEHIFVGLHGQGCANKEGLWDFNGSAWDSISSVELFSGMGIKSLVVIPGSPKFLVAGTDGQGPYYNMLPSVAPPPLIADTAEFPILAHNVDPTSSIAVKVTHPSGFHDLDVTVNAASLGDTTRVAYDNGIFPDIADGDDIYTTPLFTANVDTGDYFVSVFAQARVDSGYDDSYAQNDSVRVIAIDSAVKMSEASGKTGDLKSTLSGNPYAGNYFETRLGGSDELILTVAKDNSYPPQVFRRKPIPNAGAPEFEEKTGPYFGTPLPIGTRGVFLAEVDSISGQEMFACQNGVEPKFYINNTITNKFEDSTSVYFDTADIDSIKYSHTAAWGDYNEDGFIDLAVASLNQAHSGFTLADFDANPAVGSHISLFRGYGDHFSLVSHSVFPTGMTVLGMSWRDVDNDGDQDLVIFGFNQNAANPVVMINNGHSDTAGDYTLSLSTSWGVPTSVRSMAWTDFDHDLYPDLLVLTNDAPYNRFALLRNTGTSFSVSRIDTLGGVFETVLVGDVQQNGQQDIAVFPTRGRPEVYFLDYFSGGGVPSFKNIGPTVGLEMSSVQANQYASGGVIADFNDDHDLDVLVGWPKDQPFFYRNVRSNFLSSVDYDSSSQYNNDIPMVGKQNWLQVKLTSPGNSNRSCIGAKVVVKEETGDLRQWMHVVDGGSGRGGQDPNQLHFGLGSYSGLVTVDVYWPLPSDVTTVSGHAVNQVVQISELANKSGGCIVINSRSVKFSHNPFPGGSDWVFEWKTDVKGDLTKDQVTWRYQAGQPVGQGCLGSAPGTLHWGDPEVEVTAYYRSGSWQHRLVWKNQICSTEPCPFEFEATSGYDGCSVTSGTVQFGNFGVCIGQ